MHHVQQTQHKRNKVQRAHKTWTFCQNKQSHVVMKDHQNDGFKTLASSLPEIILSMFTAELCASNHIIPVLCKHLCSLLEQHIVNL